jgi:hypothetical protein
MLEPIVYGERNKDGIWCFVTTLESVRGHVMKKYIPLYFSYPGSTRWWQHEQGELCSTIMTADTKLA